MLPPAAPHVMPVQVSSGIRRRVASKVSRCGLLSRTRPLNRVRSMVRPIAVLVVGASAWQAISAQQDSVPIRVLDRIVATAPDSIRLLGGMRALSDGRVIVNDAGSLRVDILDAQLRRTGAVVFDTAGAALRRPGAQGGLLTAYRGDTSLWLDFGAGAIVVLDPAGASARVIAMPSGVDRTVMGVNNPPAVDPQGRLIYRRPATKRTAQRPGGSGLGAARSDSAFLVRVDVSTRRVDTIAYLRDDYSQADRAEYLVIGANGAAIGMYSAIDPLPVADGWAVLTSGAVGIVRAHDYHVDWIQEDGSITASAPVPWLWHRLTDSAKVALIGALRAKADTVTLQYGRTRVKGPHPQYVEPDVLPDYASPFVATGVVADRDDHLWIPLTPGSQPAGGAVYDVLDRSGSRVDRVQIPGGTKIAGFGPGFVFVTDRVRPNRVSLVKVALAWKR